MTLIASPLTLWIAALACAAMALRAPSARAPGRGGDGRGAGSRRRCGSPRASLPARARASPGAPTTRRGSPAPASRASCPRRRWRGPAPARRSRRRRSPCRSPASPAAAALAPALGLAGAIAPSRWLAARQGARRRALVRELPDLLDLLGICVESGMALDPALELAADRLGGTLGGEIDRVLRDLSLGTPRADAYRALVERTGTPELAQTVGALLQAEELGAPLSRALEGQAEALRVARRQGARERAARAAPKIQLVVALLMVPAVLLLVLGVLLIELSRQVGGVIGGG